MENARTAHLALGCGVRLHFAALSTLTKPSAPGRNLEMRIVCDNCGAKYQISDDKVRNKVFKIRCKKCSHTIVVRSKGEGDRRER
jgi:predicted Zn finger-like uncharacterized protein